MSAARTFGEFGVPILNGDIPDNNEEKFFNIFKKASLLAEWRIPIGCSCGNHENKGAYAEHLERYTPIEDGHSYYTFSAGNIGGLVFDCGEDKKKL